MRDIRFLLQPKYTNSRALIIGIDKYKNVSPLSYAVSDANEVKSVLENELGFPPQNTVYLTDSEATRDQILRSFIRFTNHDVELDDRIFVFFAGHGYTKTGYRGEVGYLVPFDADKNDLSTFIRWDDLTRNAELIRAKHMFFVMDACYGGLALVRNLQPGSTRFLKDMMVRYARQVLTAGKANEVVSDSGGPIPDHSLFTGHLIEGMQGKAATSEGLITAAGLMAYVYQNVAHDKDSNQTPHYGYFDGDGDFVLRLPIRDNSDENEGHDYDDLIVIPFPEKEESLTSTEQKIQKAKRLLADENGSIELHDFIIEELRRFLSQTSEDQFPLQRQFSQDELLDRVARYEKSVLDLCGLLACIAYWAKPSHKSIIQKVLSRSTDRLELENGTVAWLALRWYPLVLELYSAGIAAVDGGRYECLSDVFYTKLPFSKSHEKEKYFIEGLTKRFNDLGQLNIFGNIPGHEKHYTPLSEYLFKILQPMLDDILFIGKSYERSFDEFEVLFALAVADTNKQNQGGAWGPIGRFGWKQQNYPYPPFSRVVEEAKAHGAIWAPLAAGLFGGDYQRFINVAEEFQTILAKRNFW